MVGAIFQKKKKVWKVEGRIRAPDRVPEPPPPPSPKKIAASVRYWYSEVTTCGVCCSISIRGTRVPGAGSINQSINQSINSVARTHTPHTHTLRLTAPLPHRTASVRKRLGTVSTQVLSIILIQFALLPASLGRPFWFFFFFFPLLGRGAGGENRGF